MMVASKSWFWTGFWVPHSKVLELWRGLFEHFNDQTIKVKKSAHVSEFTEHQAA